MRLLRSGSPKIIVFVLMLLGGSALAADVESNSPSPTPETPSVVLGTPTLDFANGLYARKMYGPAISEYEKFIQTNPDSPEIASAKFRVADSHYFSKNYSSAVHYFESFVKNFPNDKRVPMAEFRIGASFYYFKNFSESIRVFTRLSKEAKDPNLRSGALFYLAKSLEAKDRKDKSIQIFEELVKVYPQSEYASYAGIAMGDTHLKANQLTEALAAYQIAADKKNPYELAQEAQFKMAEIYFSQKNYEKAESYYQKLFDENQGTEEPAVTQKKRSASLKERALLGLFYSDLHQNDLESAKKRFESNQKLVEASPYKAETLYLLACLYSDHKEYGKALPLLDEALTDLLLEEDLRDKAIFKKSFVLSELNQKDFSLKELDKLFQFGSKNLARAHFEKGEVFKTMNHDMEALSSYRKVIEQYPDTDYAQASLYETAFLHIRLNELAAARQELLDYVKKYPNADNIPGALLQIIQIDLDTQNFEAALKNASDFIAKFKVETYLDIAYYKQGVALTGLKNFSEAATAFSQIVNHYPNSQLYLDALYGMAASLEKSGDIKAALLVYEKIVKEYPESLISPKVYGRIGYLYIQTSQWDKVSAYYQDVLFNKPTMNIDPDGVFWLIQHLLDHSDYEALQKILAVLPSRFPEKDLSHEIHFFMGEASMGLKDYAKAVDYYSMAIQAKPAGAYAGHAYLGMGIASAAKDDVEAAFKNFNEALRFDQELKVTLRARFEIASLSLRAKNYAEAAKAFMMVAILYDDVKYTPMALYVAAECFLSIQKTSDAQKALSELQSRYPDSEWAKKANKFLVPAEAVTA